MDAGGTYYAAAAQTKKIVNTEVSTFLCAAPKFDKKIKCLNDEYTIFPMLI